MDGNPFDFTRPIQDESRFAGRNEELKEIEYSLKQATAESPIYLNIALIGKRASGKTSLLNMIENLAQKYSLLPVKISLNNELVENDILFFKEIQLKNANKNPMVRNAPGGNIIISIG